MTNRIQTTVPDFILTHLRRRTGQYTDMVDIFHCIRVGTNHWVGVAGDGANGSYEHFSLKRGSARRDFFTCSDKGYGDTSVALRDALNQEVQ